MLTFNFKNFKVEIAFSFLFLAAISSANGNFSVWCLAFCFLHETAHLLAMAICKIRVQGIKLYGAGIKITAIGSNAFVLLAGCFLNLSLALLLARKSPYLAAINLFLGVFNLLPIEYFDGGKLLANSGLLSEKALQLISKITLVSVAVLAVLALVFLKIPMPFSAVFTVLFIAVSQFAE